MALTTNSDSIDYGVSVIRLSSHMAPSDGVTRQEIDLLATSAVDKLLTMDGEEHEEKRRRRWKQGGLRTLPFILATEACDRFAASGFSSNLITYLTEKMHMSLVEGSNTISNFNGTANFTPIIGAIVADSFLGGFWTITISSSIYTLGMIILTLSAALPGLLPPPCPDPHQVCQKASTSQLLVLYVSLLFTAIGTGGIRPCVVAFGADQFNNEISDAAATTRGSSGKGKGRFFNLYFFSMGFALLLSLTVVVYIQDNVGWVWGFGIPTIVMAVSVVVFVLGYPLYLKFSPEGSPLTRLAQVAVAAFKKRGAVRPVEPSLLYEDKQLDAGISATGKLLHTEQLRFLDRAAIVTDGDIAGHPRLWRLSTVHRVEELKSIIRIIPIWAAGILLATASSHNLAFAIQQAKTMNRQLSPDFQIPPATMHVFQSIALLLGIILYDRLFVPIARRLTGRPSGITYLQRIGIGLAIAVLASICAALVEAKRKSVAAAHGMLDEPKAVVPISVFWLVPQYAIYGLAESFVNVGHMEFLYDQAPKSMKSTAAALFWLASSIGQYLGTFMVSVVSRDTQKRGDWLQNNINRGKLDYYYCVVIGLQVLNLGYYLVCANLFTFKTLEVVRPENPSRVMDEEGAGVSV